MAKSTRLGFTALEMSVVVSMILIFTAFILPNLVNRQQSERDRAFVVTLNRLASQAREGAIMDNRIYHLQMDGEQTLVIRKEDENGDTSTATPVATVVIPEGTTTSDFAAGNKATNAGDWDVLFYADGTSDSGGIAFERGTDRFALNIDAKAHSSVGDELTDSTLTTWDAGGYEQRQ